MGGQEELVDLLELETGDAVQHPLVPALAGLADVREGGKDRLVALLLRVDGVLAGFEERRGLVWYLTVFAEGQAFRQAREGHELLLHLRHDGGDGLFVDVGEGVFPVGPAVVDLQHEAPASEQIVLPGGHTRVPHPIILAPGVGRQHGHVSVLFGQLLHQRLQQGLGRLQKCAALYLHSHTSYGVCIIISARGKDFNKKVKKGPGTLEKGILPGYNKLI